MRKENRRWDVKEVLRILEFWSIMHNIIIEHVEIDSIGEKDDGTILFEFCNNIHHATYNHEIQATQMFESTETEHYEEHAPTVSLTTCLSTKQESHAVVGLKL